MLDDSQHSSDRHVEGVFASMRNTNRAVVMVTFSKQGIKCERVCCSRKIMKDGVVGYITNPKLIVFQ